LRISVCVEIAASSAWSADRKESGRICTFWILKSFILASEKSRVAALPGSMFPASRTRTA
jgi:hypothetical protein